MSPFWREWRRAVTAIDLTIHEPDGHFTTYMNVKDASLALVDDQVAALKSPLKAFVLLIGFGWLTLISMRFTLLPDVAAGINPGVLLSPTLTLLAVVFAWTRISRPGLVWHYLLTIIGFGQLGWIAWLGGPVSLWQLPLLGAICGVIVGFPESGSSAGKREYWNLSLRRWVLITAMTAAIVAIGLIASFGRDGAEREMHIQIRSVFASVSALLGWSTFMILAQKGVRIQDIRRVILFSGLILYYLLFNFIVMNFIFELNINSQTKIDESFFYRIVFLNSVFVVLIYFAINKIKERWHNLLILIFAMIWAMTISVNKVLAIVPIFQFMALLPLTVRFRNAALAGIYWLVLISGPALSMGITNPLVLMNSLAGTAIFAGSYWLSNRFEILEAQAQQGEDGDVEPAYKSGWLFVDRRSVAIGLVVAAAVMLLGGLLVYLQDQNQQALAQLRSKAVAERLAERFSMQFKVSEQISRTIALKTAEATSIDDGIEDAMRDVLPLLGKGHSIQWAPGAVVRLVEPRSGNEHAIGLNVLIIASQREEAIHVIENGEPHWTGPLPLVQGGNGLIYRLPVYQSGAKPSRETFIGLIQVVVDLDQFISSAAEYDLDEYDLQVWIRNTSAGSERMPKLVWGTNSDRVHPVEFSWTTDLKSQENSDGETLSMRIEAFPRKAQLLETLPARMQGLLVFAVLMGSLAAWFDQSRRKSLIARERLRDSEAFRGALIQGAGAAVIATDAEGIITLFNPAAEALLGYRADEVVGKTTPAIFHDPAETEARAQSLSKEFGRPFEPGFEVFVAKVRITCDETREWSYICKDGSRITVLLSVTAIRNDAGSITAFLGVARDITQLKAAEKARAQFIANISHELRTPLNAVLGYARLLEQAPLDGEDRDRLKRLSQASNMLFSLVNDVLDWSKIEAGEIEFFNEPFNLADRCETMMAIMAEQAQQKGLAFHFKNSPELPVFVKGDATRFQQIMFNLIGNAIKFTESGEVAVHIRMLPAGKSEHVRVRFEVSDTGIGIAEDAQKYLFERFRQVQEDSMRRYQGTGLGLAIVKELAELMGGKVEVQSELGVGSTFAVELEFERCEGDAVPSEASANDDESEVSAQPLDGKRILLVDDSDLVIELTEWLLLNAGAQVATCSNGQEALNWLDENPLPDIILMDVQMPVMDGNTAVAIIRRNAELKHLPVVAMTAGATKTNIDDAMNAGMSDCITKPFTPENLIQTLLKHLA
jgi:PAS domain S-box-containing protein